MTQTPLATTANLLTTEQAAARLMVRPQTLRAWRVRGVGPTYVRISVSRVAYRPEALDHWLAAREYSSTAEESEARLAALRGRESARKGTA